MTDPLTDEELDALLNDTEEKMVCSHHLQMEYVRALAQEVQRHKAEKLHLIRQMQSVARHSDEHGTKSRVSVALSKVNYD